MIILFFLQTSSGYDSYSSIIRFGTVLPKNTHHQWRIETGTKDNQHPLSKAQARQTPQTPKKRGLNHFEAPTQKTKKLLRHNILVEIILIITIY